MREADEQGMPPAKRKCTQATKHVRHEHCQDYQDHHGRHERYQDCQNHHGHHDSHQDRRGRHEHRQDRRGRHEHRQDRRGRHEHRQDCRGCHQHRQDRRGRHEYRQDRHGHHEYRQDRHGCYERCQDRRDRDEYRQDRRDRDEYRQDRRDRDEYRQDRRDRDEYRQDRRDRDEYRQDRRDRDEYRQDRRDRDEYRQDRRDRDEYRQDRRDRDEYRQDRRDRDEYRQDRRDRDEYRQDRHGRHEHHQDNPLRKYTFFLQSCYEKHDFTSMKWPHLDPRKYVKLAVISNEYTNSKELERFREQTIHGSIDDILEWKAPIDMKDILRPNYVYDYKKHKQTKCPVTQLLIEGAPGIGKSTFAWEVCQKWGQHQLFNEYSLVVLLKLRDKRVQEAKSVSELFYHPNPKLQSEIVDYITTTGGHGLLLILEGFDEAPASNQTMDSIFVRLFTGQELPKATVILTTRPSASAEVRRLCKGKHSRRIEIVGFGKKEIDKYIRCAFPDKRSRSDFKEYLSLYPHIHSMMYVPLNSAIVTHVYESCKSSGVVVPKTMTQLYSSLIRTLLLRYLKDKEEHKDTCTNISSFKDLPQPVYDQFCEICKIAYKGIMRAETRLIFQDLPSDFDSLGLMQSCPELYVDQGASVSYNFLHLTVQEYLAAYHISQQSRDEQVAFMREHIESEKLEVVVRFLAGLSELGSDLWDVVRGFAIRLEIFHWLFESHSPSAITSVLGSDCVYFDCGSSLPFDWYALGYCIAHSSCDWKLKLHAELESVELFLRALNLQQGQCQLRGKIKDMWFMYDHESDSDYEREPDPAIVRLLVDNMPQLSVFHNMTHLDLSLCNLTSETCNLLSKCNLQHLEYLNLGINPIGRGGAVNLITSLTKFSTIRELNLHCTSIGFEDCKALSELLASSKHIQVLDIGSKNNLSPDSVQLIVDGLSHNTSLETLNMRGSNFSSENVLHLASVLRVNTRLKELYIGSCNIQSTDSVHLAKALEENTTSQLHTLWLWNNPVGSEGAFAFASMLKKNQCLKKLHLRDDSVGVEGALELIESLKHNTTLEELWLSRKCKPPSFSTLDQTLQDRVIFWCM